MDTQEIINLIANSKKKTVAKAYISGDVKEIRKIAPEGLEIIGGSDFCVIFGEYQDILKVLESPFVYDSKIEVIARNSALPLADITKYNARIEPGAIIRDMVEIGDGAIIMMGAVINIGAIIGEKTMIDMNTVIGARAIIGKNCHIGAGSVIAGVIEPPSAQPVVIEDNVVIGANAVVLEGVRVGQNSVIAAGCVVIEDVPPFSVVAGVPGKVVKKVDEKTLSKTQIVDGLRNLNQG